MDAHKRREIWVDNVKVIACILVVLGHFFQSMTTAGIIAENDLYLWFIRTVYYFHVPLFFICSGYLYQRNSEVNTIRAWKENICKKVVSLGVPYFVFSFATWLLKTVFSSSVNTEVGGLTDSLLLHPISPYWYLYALFILFLVTPTFRNRQMAAAGMTIAVAMKMIAVIPSGGGYSVPAITYLLSDEIWFVLGMCLNGVSWRNCLCTRKLLWKRLSGILIVIFIMASVFVYACDIELPGLDFLLGLAACAAVIMTVMYIFQENVQNRLFGCFARYTLPIFLMHTIFASMVRIVLMKAGVSFRLTHVLVGIMASFAGPIVAMKVMSRLRITWLILPEPIKK